MGLTRKLKSAVRTGRKFAGLASAAPEREQRRITLNVPNPRDESPWLSLQLGYQRRPAAQGEYTRLTTHLETRVPALRREPAGSPAPHRLGRPAGDRAARKSVGLLPRLASHKLEADIDLVTCTLPLQGGALELAGQALRRFGLVPREAEARADDDRTPSIRHWHRRFARPDGGQSLLSVLYGSHLPLLKNEGQGRLHFAATVFSTVHPDHKSD